MEVTIYQRIMLILDDKQVSVNALSKLVEMSQTTLNTQLKGERALSANVVAKVLSVFPDVSAEWVIRGVGTMYHKEVDSKELSCMVAEEPKRDIINEVKPKQDSHQDDSVWHAKYEELEKRYDQLLSILGGGMRKANVG